MYVVYIGRLPPRPGRWRDLEPNMFRRVFIVGYVYFMCYMCVSLRSAQTHTF